LGLHGYKHASLGVPRNEIFRTYQWRWINKQLQHNAFAQAHAITELAVRLARPARQCLPGTLMLVYTGLNCPQPTIQTEVQPMQSSSICEGFQAKAMHPTLPARTSLTVGSTRTKMLRIFAG